MGGIRVLLVDDHEILRDGLKNLLERSSSIQVVASVGTAGEALRRVEEVALDVAVIDLSIGKDDGVELLSAMKALKPDLSTLMITMHLDEESVIRALDAGADGYMGKIATQEELIRAVTAVGKGESYLQPSLAPLSRI